MRAWTWHYLVEAFFPPPSPLSTAVPGVSLQKGSSPSDFHLPGTIPLRPWCPQERHRKCNHNFICFLVASCTAHAGQFAAEDGDSKSHQVVSFTTWQTAVLGACLALSESPKPPAGTSIFLIFRRGNWNSKWMICRWWMAQHWRAWGGLLRLCSWEPWHLQKKPSP